METKLCINCKHCVFRERKVLDRFSKPVCGLTKRVWPSTELVYGSPPKVTFNTCYDERMHNPACGRNGNLFEEASFRVRLWRRLMLAMCIA